MRRTTHQPCGVLLLPLLLLPLAGCDMHDKAWDSDSTGGQTKPTSANAPAAASGASEISITVGSRGAVTCRSNGAPIAPIYKEASVGKPGVADGTPLLIVHDNAHDTEATFPVQADLDALGTSAEGHVTVRHLGHSIVVETEGAAQLTLAPHDSQDDVDDCVRFAGDDEVGRLTARLDADPALIDGRESRTGKTALARAAETGNVDVAALLLDRRAGTEVKDSHGYSPLQTAAAAGRLGIVRLLARHGADVNALTGDGISSLALAQRQGHTEVAAFLSGAGARHEPLDGGSRPSAVASTEDSIDLGDHRSHGPFADGSRIRLQDRRLLVTGGTDSKGEAVEFDVPRRKGVWVSLQDTPFKVMVRSKGRSRVWASYTAPATAMHADKHQLD